MSFPPLPTTVDPAGTMVPRGIGLIAVQLLNDQLAHHMGDGQLATPRITNPEMFGGGGVANVI